MELCNCLPQIVIFVARNEANLLQCREMLFGFHEIALHEIGFAEVFVRASVPRIEHQCLLIMPYRGTDLPQTVIGVAKIVLNIGIAGVAECCRREYIDGAIPVAGDKRALTG